MPNRVSVKTEDLIGILDSMVTNINGCAITLKSEWIAYDNIRSFTEFRNLEIAFYTAYEQVLNALEVLKEESK